MTQAANRVICNLLDKKIKNPQVLTTFLKLTTLLFLFSCQPEPYRFALPPQPKPVTFDPCTIDEAQFARIITEVKNKNPDAIRVLPDCLKLNRTLIFRATLIDPTQFQYAHPILKAEETFVTRLAKVKPETLRFASLTLLRDQNFMEKTTYLSRDAIKYAAPELLDNLLFMRKMIALDSRNYMFGSERIRATTEFAAMAFEDDGTLLAYAPSEISDNTKLVTIAVTSNKAALQYASKRLRGDKVLNMLTETSVQSKSSSPYLGGTSQRVSVTMGVNKALLEKFLIKNYVKEARENYLTKTIANQAKFFPKNQLVSRNYITKWHKTEDHLTENQFDDMELIPADSRNYHILWKNDFKKFPNLAEKIERFLLNRHVNQNILDNLYTTYLWKIKSNPTTVAFNLYFLRNSNSNELGSGFVNVTSLTAIARQNEEKEWQLTILDVIFDNEIKSDPTYPDGHKKLELWDLYTVNKADKNPKPIFRIEDRFKEYFEIYEEQSGGKYEMIYRITP